MSASFQTFTNSLQAPGIPGRFASVNPFASKLSSQQYGSAEFVAGANGLVIGYFAWLDPSTYRIASNSGPGAPQAMVIDESMGLITTYLTGYGLTIPAGMMVGCLFNAGDCWVVNNGTTESSPGMKAYANNANGQASFAATGTPTAGGTSTASTISAQTNSSAASTIVDNVYTTGPAVTGTIVPGTVLSGTGVASGTVVQAQLSGTAGGVGTYSVSPRDQTVASTTISGTYGLLTVGGTVAGTFAVGQTLTNGSSTTYGTITGLGTGTGGAGTYYTQTQTVGSGTIDTVTNTETNWYCESFGQPGDVVKISTRQ